MQLPFSRAEFLEVFAAYNTAIWPVQAVAMLLGVLATALIYAGSDQSDRAISAILALLWAGMGIGYHWLYFSAINPAAYLFGSLFVAVAIVFLLEGAVRGRVRFRPRSGAGGWIAAVLIACGIAIYPAISLFVTHPYPQTPLFGVAPCPTTIFTLGMLMLAAHPRPLLLAALPIAWSLVGASAAILLNVPQDLALLAAATAWIVFRQPSATAR